MWNLIGNLLLQLSFNTVDQTLVSCIRVLFADRMACWAQAYVLIFAYQLLNHDCWNGVGGLLWFDRWKRGKLVGFVLWFIGVGLFGPWGRKGWFLGIWYFVKKVGGHSDDKVLVLFDLYRLCVQFLPPYIKFPSDLLPGSSQERLGSFDLFRMIHSLFSIALKKSLMNQQDITALNTMILVGGPSARAFILLVSK